MIENNEDMKRSSNIIPAFVTLMKRTLVIVNDILG